MTLTAPERPQTEGKLLYKVEEAIDILGLGRTTVFELLRSGRLRSVQVGRSRRIPTAALREYVERLEREAAGVKAR
ncbi:DNA-binding protein [Bailinhaonella thermotolerans]|uniref:DNA-binding protein n=2 Tax=Bailinhaonella thermotolerans TaxID=1070861 RepID=A0A3A4A0W3_9ACTN|nr:DNA-binding protein [Bailinhaonella thermotolerans]